MFSSDIPITPQRVKHALCAQGMPESWASDVEVALAALQEQWNSEDHDAKIRMALRLCPEIAQLLGAQAPQTMQATIDSSSIVIR